MYSSFPAQVVWLFYCMDSSLYNDQPNYIRVNSESNYTSEVNILGRFSEVHYLEFWHDLQG